jgi:RimJ/RimL family protein N-acetyltransferase
MYLMATYAFEELGYRRYEWKCNALNAASRKAALRYGFVFEGFVPAAFWRTPLRLCFRMTG